MVEYWTGENCVCKWQGMVGLHPLIGEVHVALDPDLVVVVIEEVAEVVLVQGPDVGHALGLVVQNPNLGLVLPLPQPQEVEKIANALALVKNPSQDHYGIVNHRKDDGLAQGLLLLKFGLKLMVVMQNVKDPRLAPDPVRLLAPGQGRTNFLSLSLPDRKLVVGGGYICKL